METTDVGIGTQGAGDTPDTGDFYATGDARTPKVVGKGCKCKSKKCKCKKGMPTFKRWLKNESSNLDYVMKHIDEDIPKSVVKRAYELFKLMGISDDDFGLQTSDFDYAVFGGTNRVIANLDYDDNKWKFNIDRELTNFNRVERWDKIPKEYKTILTTESTNNEKDSGYPIDGPYNLRDKISWIFSPDRGKTEYEIGFWNGGGPDNDWEIGMFVNGSSKIPEKTNNPIKILNTRKKILKKFIQTYQPNTITSYPTDIYRTRLWMTTFKKWGYSPSIKKTKRGTKITIEL